MSPTKGFRAYFEVGGVIILINAKYGIIRTMAVEYAPPTEKVSLTVSLPPTNQEKGNDGFQYTFPVHIYVYSVINLYGNAFLMANEFTYYRWWKITTGNVDSNRNCIKVIPLFPRPQKIPVTLLKRRYDGHCWIYFQIAINRRFF